MAGIQNLGCGVKGRSEFDAFQMSAGLGIGVGIHLSSSHAFEMVWFGLGQESKEAFWRLWMGWEGILGSQRNETNSIFFT